MKIIREDDRFITFDLGDLGEVTMLKGFNSTEEEAVDESPNRYVPTKPLDWWTRLLGEAPEATFTPDMAEAKCYKCGSKDYERCEASAWTSKERCKVCGYYTYTVHADFMGGALHEDVAISPKDLKI